MRRAIRLSRGIVHDTSKAVDLEAKVVVAAAGGFVLDDETRAAVGLALRRYSLIRIPK